MTKRLKIAVYLVFWVMAYIVLLSIFTSSSEVQEIDYIYTAIFMFTLMIAVRINETVIRPKFLNAGKYSLFVSFTIFNIIALSWTNQILFSRLIDFILPGYYFISYYSFFDIQNFFIAFVGLATLIGLSMEWFQLQQLQKEKANAEFKALVNQVNPHFLFNALNVVYTLSVTESKETSSAIIKLSDILRYVIYQSSHEKVKVTSEATMLREYIDLQRYRVHPSTQINFEENISNENAEVAPVLFLPLIENAFKHGVHNKIENAFVRITLREQNGVVTFIIENNVSSSISAGGIGLKNLRERLKLLYPDRHSFEITEVDHTFKVTMQLSI